MQGFRVLARYTFCDPTLHASINMLSRARVPRTASSVRTVSVPWPGIVLMLKESEGSVSFVLAKILGTPSAGEPNRIIGFLELFHRYCFLFRSVSCRDDWLSLAVVGCR